LFKLGFSTLGCPSYDIDQVIALAQNNNFSGVEIRFIRGEVDLPKLGEFSPARIRETRRRFDDGGIRVVCIDTSVRMNALDEGERRKQLESARIHCAIAVGLGARYLRVFGGSIPQQQDRQATLDAIAKGLSQVADETSARGVISLLETHDHFSTSERILDLFSRGASGNLGILWDTLHTYRHGESGAHTWTQLGQRIKHIHLKDSAESSAEGFRLVLTGEGTVPIPAFLELLKTASYNGHVHFEWEKAWHPEIAEPEVAIPHFARYMSGRMFT
jgi:sugar phosphate isomerase/epimerase